MRRTLFRNVFVPYLLIVAVGISVTFFTAWHFMRVRYEKEIEKTLEMASILCGEIVANEIISNENDLQKVAEKLGRETGVRITVIDETGKVLADSEKNPQEMENHKNRPEIAGAFRNGAGLSARRSDTLQTEMMYFARRQEISDGRQIVVRSALPLSGVKERLWDVNSAVIAGFAVAAVLSVIIGFFIVRWLTNSISQMKETAQAIASGKFTIHAPATTDDEIGELGRALNEMRDTLKDKIEALSEKKTQIEIIIDTMPDGLIVVDRNETIVLANKTAERLIGYVLPVGRRLGEVVRNENIISLVKSTLSGEKTEPIKTVSLSGTRLEMRGVVVPNAGALVIVRDISEAERLERMRKEFIANASHELRTPVTLISGCVETLNAGAAEDSSKRRQFLDVLEKNVKQLSNLIEDLLKLSTLDEEGRLHKEEKVDITRLVSEVIEQFSEFATKKGIYISPNMEKQPLTVIGDSALLKQAIANLIDNAIKYTNPVGTVTVSVKAVNGKVVTEVADTGIGIDKEHLPRIFERFYRVDKSRSRDLGGTGLGLSIVKHVVQAHGGEVSVQSEPGKGSKFTIILPQAD